MAAGGPGPAPFDPRGVGGAGACPQSPASPQRVSGEGAEEERGRGRGGEAEPQEV